MIRLIERLGLTPTDDAQLWRKKWSTRIAELQLSFAGALLVWGMLDSDIRATLPGWIPMVIGAGMLVLGFAAPLAVNSAQKKLSASP